MSRLREFVSEKKLLLGVVHLAPLPGSPGHDGRGLGPVIDRARRDADALLEAGFDGWLIENLGDAPYFRSRVPAHVVASMTRIGAALPRGGELICGVNVLRNDARSALGVAAALDLDMIRINVHTGAAVTDQGIVEGTAAETLRDRMLLGDPPVSIVADVDVKHASPLGRRFDLAEAARECAERGLADGLILTGKATGEAVSRGHVRLVREAVRDRPLLVGSGVTAETVDVLMDLADGAIVGTAVKEEGDLRRPVDPARARALVASAR